MASEFPKAYSDKTVVAVSMVKKEIIEGETGFRDIQFKLVKYITDPSLSIKIGKKAQSTVSQKGEKVEANNG